MTRLLAGAAGGGARDEDRLAGTAAAALERTAPASRLASPRLALAWTGEEPAVEDDVLCAVDGRLEGAEALSRELGLPEGERDARVLARAYRVLGEPVLERLSGRFAVVVWDTRARRGLLAVDPLGVRPLHVARVGGGVFFASELRDLLELLPSRPAPDRLAVARWIVDGALEPGQTLFSGVRRFPGGTYVRLGVDASDERRYWQPRFREPLRRPRAELVAEVRRVAGEAVGRRLPAEGRAAVLLSGGLDSASVAALAAERRGSPGDLVACSAHFPDYPDLDESELVALVRGHVGLPGAAVEVGATGALADALRFLDEWEVPSVSPNLFVHRGLLGLAREEGATVVLDGQGGDELFGCAAYLLADELRRGHVRRAALLAARLPGVGGHPSRRVLRRLLWELGAKGAAPHAAHRLAHRLPGRAGTPSWLRESSAREYVAGADRWAWKRLDGPRWWAELADQVTVLRERMGAHDFLRRKLGSAGLVGGHPLLDDLELVELVLRLPPELSFDPALDRPLLRHAMAGAVPDDVRLRPDKSYFTVLFRDTLSGPDWPAVLALLGDPGAEVGAYVDLERVRSGLLEVPVLSRRGGWSWPVWRLATIECWLRRERDPSSLRALPLAVAPVPQAVGR